MPEIFKVQYHDQLYDIRDATKRDFYVKGTQTSATNAWTGTLASVDALFEGLSIDYWLPHPTTGEVTLDLELKDRTHTGPVFCYYSGTTRLRNHIPANNVCTLVYQTVRINRVNYTGWWLLKTYDARTEFEPVIGKIKSASKLNDISVDTVTGWSAGALPTLGTPIKADDITGWSAGTLPGANVDNEVLILSFGTLPSLSYSEKTIPNVTGVGSSPSLSIKKQTVPNYYVEDVNVMIGLKTE